MSVKVMRTRLFATIPWVFSMVLAFVCTASIGQAAITWTGNVYPADPTAWNSGTLGYVGQNSTGTLTVNGGSVLQCYIGYLGCNSGSNGNATVTGTASTWTSDRLNVAFQLGTGTLTVVNGGVVSTGRLYASRSNLLGNGTINAKGGVLDADIVFDADIGTQPAIAFGSGGTLNLNVDGTVELGAGFKGAGTITISEGVAVAASTGYLGSEFGSTGTATVTGAGSKWTVNNDLYVGYSGNGTLNVGSGDTRDDTVAARTFYLGYGGGTNGTCNINGGGTLQAQTMYGGKGSSNVNWNDGTIRNYDANTDLTISSRLIFQLAAAGTHDFHIDAGHIGTIDAALRDATTGGTLAKTGAGTLTLTVNNSYSGETTIEAGRLTVTGSILNTSAITVGPAGVLELARTSGSATAASLPIANDGTLVLSTASQSVGAITGAGVTKVRVGASLTAHSIAQESLVIGSTSGVMAVPEPHTFCLLLAFAVGSVMW